MSEGNEGTHEARLLGLTVSQWAFVLLGVMAVLALIALSGAVGILDDAGAGGELQPTIDKINNVKDPATVAVGATSGLGVVGGGVATSLGMPQGMKTMAISGGTLVAVGAGNGIIA